MAKCQRLHVHFYECDKKGDVLNGNAVRCGSDVGIVVSARQCMDDGIVCYRSANNAILTEGINGVVGVQYFRFIHRLRRDPTRKRTALRHREGWMSAESEEDEGCQPQTMFTQTNPEEIDLDPVDAPSVEDGDIRTAVSEEESNGLIETPPPDDAPPTPALGDIAGLNPFSSAGPES